MKTDFNGFYSLLGFLEIASNKLKLRRIARNTRQRLTTDFTSISNSENPRHLFSEKKLLLSNA